MLLLLLGVSTLTGGARATGAAGTLVTERGGRTVDSSSDSTGISRLGCWGFCAGTSLTCVLALLDTLLGGRGLLNA